MKALTVAMRVLFVPALLLSACGGEETVPRAIEQAVGVTGPAFYVDGALYRTVGTPTALPQDAPVSSFDTIYDVSPSQTYNVADAAPGQPGYNGGRWLVQAITFGDFDAALATHDINGSGDFDSDEEIKAALAAGDAIDLGIVKSFVCPAIRLPSGA